MSIEYLLIDEFPTAQINQLFEAAKLIDPFPLDSFTKHLNRQHQILCCFAYDAEQMIGYKIGYQIRDGYFESWVGGVSPAYRRQGIAKNLIEQQHQWCVDHGYSYINTMTSGDNQAMLIANLKAGYQVVGTYHDRSKILKVIMQKHLKQ